MRLRVLPASLLIACTTASAARAADPEPTKLSIAVRGAPVSALLLRPGGARALLVLAHGQVMNIEHPFMVELCAALAQKRIATLRFNFPYAEAGRPEPDRPRLLVEAVVAATQEGERRRAGLPLFAGGKSLGALAAAQAAQDGSLPKVTGLVLLTYPLHAPGLPSTRNARPLEGLTLPILFVQGSEDPVADEDLLRGVVGKLGAKAKLVLVSGADHALAPAQDSGRGQAELYEEAASAVAGFVATLAPAQGG
jgi:hypothetical protein